MRPALPRPGAPTPEAPATRIAGVALEHPLLNAAGTARTPREAERLARSSVAAVTVGSATLSARDGNAGEVFAAREDHAVNALGMPNRGAAGLAEDLPPIAAAVHGAGKPLVVSVAGFAPEEHGELARVAAAGGADLVELNLGCPNVWAGGVQHRIASFDPGLVAASVRAAREALGDGALPPVGAKLSPIGDPVLLGEVAAALVDAGAAFVVASNTFPNGLALDGRGRPVLDVGYGGVSGGALRAIALGQVAQLRDLLPDAVDVVGVGGAATGGDLRALLDAGAAAVGAATVYWTAGEDPSAYGDLLADWVG